MHLLPLSDRARRGSWVAATAIATVIAGSEVAAQQPPRFGERVDVVRIILDARVLDDRGNPLADLTAGDFKVTIDGETARVETAMWVGTRDTDLDATPPESTPLAKADAPIGPGRLIVFLFQKDLEPSRIVGLMRMLQRNRQFLDTLATRTYSEN